MRTLADQDADSQAFWSAIRRSAALVQGAPVWTQAGIVLSQNFEGGCSEAGRDEAPPRAPLEASTSVR
jgi:hypothetical protein